jgi:hypothetical protein
VTLVDVFTQVAVQSVCPLGQAQVPLVQVCVSTQALPQLPQLALLLLRSTHAVPHNVCVPGQVQLLATQLCVPTQALPHSPQLVRLTWVLTQ